MFSALYIPHSALRRLRLTLALLLLSTSILAACDSNPTPTLLPQPDTAPTSQVIDPTPTVAPPATEVSTGPTSPTIVEPTETLPDVPTPALTPEPPQANSSLDKIATAEQAGKIDHDTALLYQLYAYFDFNSLPAEYRGDDSNLTGEPIDLLHEASERLDAMPSPVRAEVEPFLLRPDNPASFWNRPPTTQASTQQAIRPALAKANPSPTAPAGWQYVDSPNTQTRVWYPKPESGEGLSSTADKLSREIDTSEMWSKEKQVMLGKYEPCTDARLSPNGGDGRLDVYLVALGAGAPRQQVALPTENNGLFFGPNQVLGKDCAVAGYILLNSAPDFKYIKASMAHELFHAFQAAVTVRMGDAEWKWWSESTATWAMDLVYPTLNVEQDFLLKDFNSWVYQRTFAGPLTCTGRQLPCDYAAYLWPFYLTRGGGGATNDYIGRVWEQSKERQPIDVMADMNGWADQWKQFALWNWNEGPADFYRDPDENGSTGHIAPLKQLAIDITGKGRFEAPPQPWTKRGWGWPLDLGKTYSADVNLPPATYDYYVVGKPADNSGVLEFKFAGLNKPNAGAVQAIITIGDPDKPAVRYVEDWSNRTGRKFCLDRPNEYATNVVVIVSNSNLRPGDRLEGKLQVTAKADTCPNTSNMNYTVGGSYSLNTPPQQVVGIANGSTSTYEQVESTWSLKFESRDNAMLQYSFMSTNQVDMHASASLSGHDEGISGTSSGQLSGSATTHNPTQQGDSGYGIRTLATLGNQYNNLPDPGSGGHLTLTKMNGKDAYIMTLGITPIITQYTTHSFTQYGCANNSIYTIQRDFDNSTFTTTSVQGGNPECFSHTGPEPPNAGPFVFGAVQLAINQQRGPLGSYDFIAGYYDPKAGYIDGSETYATSSCLDALRVDPLQDFVHKVDNNLYSPHPGFDAGASQGRTCRLYYTIHWRIDLPKQP